MSRTSPSPSLQSVLVEHLHLEDSQEAPRTVDHDLLLRAHRRDESAVKKLYRSNADMLFRAVGRILGVQDPDAEDVVQVAFLAALDSAPRFDGRSKVSTWMVGIAAKKALDHVRARKRRRRFQEFATLLGDCAERVFAPRRFVDAHSFDDRELAEKALSQLSHDQRAIFVLVEVEGLTLAESSVALEANISTLHGRLQSARKRLDEILENLRAPSAPRNESLASATALAARSPGSK